MLPMFQRIGPAAFKKDLTNTVALLQGLGNPHHSFRSIHIAGTNGKGSLTHMIGALAIQAGMKTGLYTSPHYKDFRERIKIGNQLIPPGRVITFMRDHRDLIQEVQPSFFELTVAMAFDHFAREKVDLAVIETGMGGRLDSTNVLKPILSVITNIGYDHMSFLGDTLPAIAGEKAGIIKGDIPVVIGEEHPETVDVFRVRAQHLHAPISFASRTFQFMSRVAIPQGQQVLIHDKSTNGLLTIRTDLEGPYQIRNIITYLEVARILNQKGLLHVEQRMVLDALSSVRQTTRFIGRWQTIQEHPKVLCDSAHNAEGLTALFHGLERSARGALRIVFGTVSDKELDRVWPCLPEDAVYYFASARVPRAMEAQQLARFGQSANRHGKAYASVKGALRAADRAAGPDDLIVVCGSIFVVAEVLP